MMLQWSLKARERRQFFWTAFCVLSLLENQVSGDAIPSTLTPRSLESTAAVVSSITRSTAVAPSSSSTKNPSATKASSTGTVTPGASSNISIVTSSPSNTTSAVNSITQVTPLPTTGNETSASSNETTTSLMTSHTSLQYTSTQQSNNFSDSPITAQAGDSSMKGNITCLNIKHVTTSHVICLKLNETYSCHDFKEKKGEHFKSIICEKKSNECDIKLADSELDNRCILLVEVNKKEPAGVEVLDAFLQKQSALKELGIHYEKQAIENHKSYTRKTLTALVTSGLLLAFLGLAGYFLMKRRSWSPMGERLGEDPYYTENGNHGNTVITVASHKPSDLQDKPNLNGGAQENGTGQPTSKNGQSSKPHVVADTEL